jgi:hypothetical protein
MEVGQGPNWGCSAKGKKIIPVGYENKVLQCNCTIEEMETPSFDVTRYEYRRENLLSQYCRKTMKINDSLRCGACPSTDLGPSSGHVLG